MAQPMETKKQEENLLREQLQFFHSTRDALDAISRRLRSEISNHHFLNAGKVQAIDEMLKELINNLAKHRDQMERLPLSPEHFKDLLENVYDLHKQIRPVCKAFESDDFHPRKEEDAKKVLENIREEVGLMGIFLDMRCGDLKQGMENKDTKQEGVCDYQNGECKAYQTNEGKSTPQPADYKCFRAWVKAKGTPWIIVLNERLHFLRSIKKIENAVDMYGKLNKKAFATGELETAVKNHLKTFDREYQHLEHAIKDFSEMPEDMQRGIVGMLMNGEVVSMDRLDQARATLREQRIASIKEAPEERRPKEAEEANAELRSLYRQGNVVSKHSKTGDIFSREHFMETLRDVQEKCDQGELSPETLQAIRGLVSYGNTYCQGIDFPVSRMYVRDNGGRDSRQKDENVYVSHPHMLCSAYRGNPHIAKHEKDRPRSGAMAM